MISKCYNNFKDICQHSKLAQIKDKYSVPIKR